MDVLPVGSAMESEAKIPQNGKVEQVRMWKRMAKVSNEEEEEHKSGRQ